LANQVFIASVYSDAGLTNLVSGKTVRVSGDLPIGGYATAYPVDSTCLQNEDVLAAYDVTVYQADGTKFDFDKPLTVSFDLPDIPAGLQNKDLALLYIPEDQQPETLSTPVNVTDTGVSFDVQHFSTYAVTVISVSQWSIYLDDGLIAYQRAATGANATYAGTVTSTYPGEVHSFNLSSTNQNLAFTSVTKDGVEQLPSSPFAISTLGGSTAPFLNINFTQNTQIIIKYDNRYSSGATTSITLTVNITVNTPNPNIGIKDTIVQDGLLNAVLSPALSPDVVSYTWTKCATANGTYVPVDPDALENDGASINVAVDGGAQMFYQVTATLSDDSTYTSDPYQVPYNSRLVNGSFEDNTAGVTPGTSLAAGNGTSAIVAETKVPGWHTTEDDRMVEIWGRYFKPGQPGGLTFDSASPDSQYFAELNANSDSTLYQDVLVVPGSTLYWSLAHRGRNSATINDVMNVVIMPTSQVPVNITSAQAEAITQTADKSTMVTTISDNNTAWNSGNGGENYTGQYTVPAGVYVVRFFFVSIVGYSPTGAAAVGNLLDDVEFNADLPYKIEYYVNGKLQTTSWQDRSAFGTIINANGTITDPSGAVTTNTEMAALFSGYDTNPTYTLQKTMSTTWDPVTEQYLSAGKSLNGATSFKLTTANQVLQLYYVTQGLVVDKVVTGVAAADMPDSYSATFGLYDDLGSLVATTTVTLADDSFDGSMQFLDKNGDPVALNIPARYTIKELATSDITNYTLAATTSQGVTGVLNSNETTIAAGSSDPRLSVQFDTSSAYSVYKAYFTNDYKLGTTTLTISKTVVGDLADLTREFTFTALLKDSTGTPVTGDFAYTGGVIAGTGATPPDDGTLHFDSGGAATFNLSHGQSITLQDVSLGSTVEIVEAPDPSAHYRVSYLNSAATTTTPVVGNDTGSVTLSPDQEFDFTNRRAPVVLSGLGAGKIEALLPELSTVVMLAMVLITGTAVANHRKRGGEHGAR